MEGNFEPHMEINNLDRPLFRAFQWPIPEFHCRLRKMVLNPWSSKPLLSEFEPRCLFARKNLLMMFSDLMFSDFNGDTINLTNHLSPHTEIKHFVLWWHDAMLLHVFRNGQYSQQHWADNSSPISLSRLMGMDDNQKCSVRSWFILKKSMVVICHYHNYNSKSITVIWFTFFDCCI